MKIEIYTKDNCIWCDRAKNLLNSVDLTYTEKDLSDDNERQKFYKKVGEGVSTVCLLYTSPSPRDWLKSSIP